MNALSFSLSTVSVVVLLLVIPSSAWTPLTVETSTSRRNFLSSIVAGGGALVAVTTMDQVPAAMAVDRLNISDEQLKQIVKDDILKRQFLVTGNLTPEIYKPTATFTDEIDTYKMDQWMKGTQKLFVGEKSDVRLVGDVGKIVTFEEDHFSYRWILLTVPLSSSCTYPFFRCHSRES